MLIQSQPTESFPGSGPVQSSRMGGTGSVVANNGIHGASVAPMDLVTYSNLVNGSIFSIPKSWSPEKENDMLVTVYSFVKTFVG